MITIKDARTYALSFNEVEELPHFEKPSFRVNKKIFLTLDEKNKKGSVKLSAIDQDVFSKMNPKIIYRVPNKWGLQGWTFVELDAVDKDVFKDLLTSAYCEVAPARLSEKYR